MADITLGGDLFHTNGDLPKVGDKAADFCLVTSDLNNVSLSDYQGKKKLLSVFPSMDTPICALSTKKFNSEAITRKDMVFLMISADLPFAMSRFCSVENADSIVPLSLMRSKQFAEDYGVLIEDGPLAGVTARAVFVIDENDIITHADLVKEIKDEPNYEAALQAL